MKAQSVRDLKQELVVPGATPEAFLERLGVSDTRTLRSRFLSMSIQPPKREVALGITKGTRRGDYRLAARIQSEDADEANRIARAITSKASGEADVTILRDVRGPRTIPPTAAAASPSYFRRRHRPLEPGLSVGHVDITAGTIGALVEDARGLYVLSNNHVLADVNQGRPGDPIAQPGPIDKKPDTGTLVAVLDRFIPINFQGANVVDCALGRIDQGETIYPGLNAALADPDGDDVVNTVVGPRSLGPADLGREVVKAGRTTGVTRGRITSVELDFLRVDMGTGIAVFNDQVEIQGVGAAFSAGGDSGSLILDPNGYAVALLFAGGSLPGGGDVTFGCPITDVLRLLGVNLVT